MNYKRHKKLRICNEIFYQMAKCITLIISLTGDENFQKNFINKLLKPKNYSYPHKFKSIDIEIYK
jgi:hypothetical protein